jgi:hypothetical protein
MADDLSNSSAHKLRALLTHNWHDSDKGFPALYVAACRRWFAALTDSERQAGESAVAAFGKGHETEAERIASALPPAPVCPLI